MFFFSGWWVRGGGCFSHSLSLCLMHTHMDSLDVLSELFFHFLHACYHCWQRHSGVTSHSETGSLLIAFNMSPLLSTRGLARRSVFLIFQPCCREFEALLRNHHILAFRDNKTKQPQGKGGARGLTITVDPVAIAAPCWLFTLMLYPQHNIPLFRIIVIVTVTTANITQRSETEDNLDQSFIVHRSRFFRSRMNFYMNLARSHEHKKKKTQRHWAASLGQRRISRGAFFAF